MQIHRLFCISNSAIAVMKAGIRRASTACINSVMAAAQLGVTVTHQSTVSRLHTLEAAHTLGNGNNIPELQIPDREIDDGGILLPEEVVLGEALEVQHQVGGQARQAVPPPPHLDVIVHPAAVELVQQLEDGDLHKRSLP